MIRLESPMPRAVRARLDALGRGPAGLALDRAHADATNALVRVLAAQLAATRTIAVRHGGRITDTREVPDHAVQLRAISLALRLRGALGGKANG